MSTIKPIRTEADYEAALARIDALMDAEPGTPKARSSMFLPTSSSTTKPSTFPWDTRALAAIQFRMEQAGLTQRDLIPFIGSRAKVSEVLSGKRPLTLPMARALHEHLGIPADVLLHGPGAVLSEPLAGIEWIRFPLKAMARLGWIPEHPISWPAPRRSAGPDPSCRGSRHRKRSALSQERSRTDERQG